MKIGKDERGSIVVLTLLILALLAAFVALAVNRATSETLTTTNDVIETRTFAAAEASLEVMTREFDKIFEQKLAPEPSDLDRVRTVSVPGFSDYEFNQSVVKTKDSKVVDMTGTLLKGLKAIRDEWKFETVATDRNSGVQVALRRWIYNNRIPLFQFGIFYNGDLEFYPGPPFQFGGRVHSNGNIFFMAINGLWFSSRISAHKHIITDVLRNGLSVFDQQCRPNPCDRVYIKDAAGNYVQLRYNMGSLLSTPNGTPILDSTYPRLYLNPNWNTYQQLFQGNLLANTDKLNLPLVIGGGANIRYIDLIKRAKNVGDLHNLNGSIVPVTSATADNLIVRSERYANKKGIRISLDDEQRRLPGCANATGQPRRECGVQLAGPGNDGYQPLPMNDGRQATRVNGIRLRGGSASTRQVWIKIELVDTNGTIDVTEDILSLGVTEPLNPGDPNDPDSRSIIKIQRFFIPGIQLTQTDNRHLTYENGRNMVVVGQDTTFPGEPSRNFNGRSVVPFPIKMFDTREGVPDDTATLLVPSNTVPWAGVMSIIDIDIANLRKLLMGDFDSIMPQSGTLFSDANRDRNDRIRKGLTAADIPEAKGWVLYISDRRGDRDFDGQYDMEDVYPDNLLLASLEDVNDNGRLDVDFGREAPRYTDYDTDFPSCAVIDHPYYRRGVRLINGTVLPGRYDAANPANTKGFTVASENGVYVRGNYNATGVNRNGLSSSEVTPPERYLPYNTVNHIPASIAADAITILSNSWQDSYSFRYPYTRANRRPSETTIRFAMLAGDARSGLDGNPHQGSYYLYRRLNGGVHNFKRFLEDWASTVPLHYTGSLINLYNSQNNNGTFKCCTRVYWPPHRDWSFDTSFLDPDRLPPGTPFIHNIQLTGFQRVN
ncbi:MAG: hypothetical protein D6687_10770 [Acidobacteria bacterium]|jgi:hypothetical protein|nr:MAG: hypothetical protein D6687_10770 [Acidobacteriota bacterium]GIU81410.1 MAG: hypothetical protein KatS3mg006_0474 [Pyrinomonadaceae bacterium]